MDLVLLSGAALMCMALGAMSCLIHAELRDRRRLPHRRVHPSLGSYGRGAPRRPSPGQGRRRPVPPPPYADPWTPFTVRADTTLADIKGQYRTLARRYHPDCGGDPRMMARINGLYAELLRRKTTAGS